MPSRTASTPRRSSSSPSRSARPASSRSGCASALRSRALPIAPIGSAYRRSTGCAARSCASTRSRSGSIPSSACSTRRRRRSCAARRSSRRSPRRPTATRERPSICSPRSVASRCGSSSCGCAPAGSRAASISRPSRRRPSTSRPREPQSAASAQVAIAYYAERPSAGAARNGERAAELVELLRSASAEDLVDLAAFRLKNAPAALARLPGAARRTGGRGAHRARARPASAGRRARPALRSGLLRAQARGRGARLRGPRAARARSPRRRCRRASGGAGRCPAPARRRVPGHQRAAGLDPRAGRRSGRRALLRRRRAPEHLPLPRRGRRGVPRGGAPEAGTVVRLDDCFRSSDPARRAS